MDDLTDPVDVARMFLSRIRHPEIHENALRALVEPESADKWGDFVLTSASLVVGGFAGLHNEATPSIDDRRVVYVPVLSEDDMKSSATGPRIVQAVLTMVWRADLSRWVVFALGDHSPPSDALRNAPTDR